jgi:hypothetical protein
MTADEGVTMPEDLDASVDAPAPAEDSVWGLSKKLAGRSARGVGRAYDKTRSAVTQEAAWTEVSGTVDTLVDVVCAQHAMILDLLERVESLENMAQTKR